MNGKLLKHEESLKAQRALQKELLKALSALPYGFCKVKNPDGMPFQVSISKSSQFEVCVCPGKKWLILIYNFKKKQTIMQCLIPNTAQIDELKDKVKKDVNEVYCRFEKEV